MLRPRQECSTQADSQEGEGLVRKESGLPWLRAGESRAECAAGVRNPQHALESAWDGREARPKPLSRSHAREVSSSSSAGRNRLQRVRHSPLPECLLGVALVLLNTGRADGYRNEAQMSSVAG